MIKLPFERVHYSFLTSGCPRRQVSVSNSTNNKSKDT
jgi:hypothetical protein